MFVLHCPDCGKKQVFVYRLNKSSQDYPFVACRSCGKKSIPRYLQKMASKEYKRPRRIEAFLCGFPLGVVGLVFIGIGIVKINTILVFAGGLLFNIYMMLVLMSFVLWKSILRNSYEEYQIIKKAMNIESFN